MSCPFTHDDGAYVLGALSPTERAEFERHLDDCPRCARSVQELAGLPGLLARVDAEMLEPPPVEPVPGTLLPALVRVARRTQRRRSFATAAAAAAAAITLAVGAHAMGALGGTATPVAGASPTTAPTTTVTLPVGQAMVPLEPGSVRATLALRDVAWGTRLDLTCTYASTPATDYEQGGTAAYSLVIRTKDGRTEQVATWRSVPGRTMRLSAATAASRADIASAEVRTADGEPILRLTT